MDGGDGGKTRSLTAEAAGEPDAFPIVERRPDDLAVILYTSGTTGLPKGVALSHDNLESNARSAASLNELGREDWAVAVLPLSHSYGLTVMNAGHILGSRAALLRWFHPEAVLQTIQEFRAVSMSAVPTMLLYLLNYPEAGRFDTRPMRVVGLRERLRCPSRSWSRSSGSSAARSWRATASPRPRRWCRRTASPARARSARWAARFPASRSRSRTTWTGRCPPARWARCASAGGTSWSATTAIRRRPPGRCGADGCTPGTWDGSTTTDFLFIVERKKDLIIRGGFNIYPREVEEVLYAHPKVAEAAVVGMKDALMGEDVLAFVVLRSGERASAEEIGAFCEGRLARFKCPKQIRFVDSLPKSPIGKILRKELRTQT